MTDSEFAEKYVEILKFLVTRFNNTMNGKDVDVDNE
jgi:hypothetical protein